MIVYRMYIVPFTFYLIVLLKICPRDFRPWAGPCARTRKKIRRYAIVSAQEENCPIISGKETTAHHAQALKLSLLQQKTMFKANK